MPDDLMTTQEVALYLRVPVATLYAWRTGGVGPPGSRVGRHLRYRHSDVDKWLTSRVAVRKAHGANVPWRT
jgi:excisionase family DNA binding protein